MTDIVEQLRNLREVARWPIISETADEIERLRAAIHQIGTVCTDNAISTADHRMALDFVRQVAVGALYKRSDG